MRRPRLLDLYCGQGGVARGYHAAGFDVVGVDTFATFAQSRYPYESVKADAIEYLAGNAHRFDAIHASPPCQHASAGTRAMRAHGDDRHPELIGPTRELLEAWHWATGTPYVIENVAGADLVDPLTLCWSMFYPAGDVADHDGVPLRMERHRLWESPIPLVAPGPCRHTQAVQVGGAYGGARSTIAGAKQRRGGYVPTTDVQATMLGLEDQGLTQWGLHQSIPPVYAQWVGLQLRAHVKAAHHG
jgi:DNA (cytosine-5)-methyltransferase 1